MNHDAATFRALLEEMVTLPETTARSAAELHHLFRDCRLEIIRLSTMPISAAQAHQFQQMEYRLEMVACKQALPESIAPEAKHTLEAFGW